MPKGGYNNLFVERAFKLSIRDRYLKGLLANIQYRCTNPKDKRFKDYGGRGIECRITLNDLTILYERDRPDLMIRPSIDRKENEGHYELENCQFLEMMDNRKKAKRREYLCAQCGTLALPEKFEGKKLCPKCNHLARVAGIKYPAFVFFVIDQARQRGFEIDGYLQERTYQASHLRLIINGHEVRVHYAALQSSTGSANKYWRFNITDPEIPFRALVAKHKKQFRCWIVSKDKNIGRTLYVPVQKAKGGKGGPAKTNWTKHENAWHLLATGKEKAA